MPLQRRLLYAMLALLGLAALAGVSTIFLPSKEFLARVAFTLLFAAIAIAIAMPASKMLERQERRSGGLYVMTAVVIGFCLSLAGVWGNYFFPNMAEPFGLTTFAYVCAAVAAGVILAIGRAPSGRQVKWVGLTLTCVCFAISIALIWDHRVGWGLPNAKLGETLGVLSGMAVPMGAALFGTRGDGKWWRWIGVAASIGVIAMGLYSTWVQRGDDPSWFVVVIIVACAAAGANVLLRLPLRAGQRWLAWATTGCLVLTAIAAMFVSMTTRGFEQANADDLGVRMFSAGSIVTTCGVLAMAVLMGFNRRMLVTEAKSLEEIRTIALACPRCAKKQEATVGESRCEGCGLIFLFKFAEPRCVKCDYSLLDIKGGVCPECGEKIST